MASKAAVEAGKAVVRGYFDDSMLGRGLRRAEVTTRKFVRSFGSAGKTIDRQWKPVSRSIREITREANKATTALGAMARASAKAGMKGAGAIAKGAGKAGSAVGGAIGGAGKYMLGAGALGAGLGIKKTLDTISDSAQINATAKAFGMTAEAASGLFGVFKANGAENANESVESLVTLAGRVKDVLNGTGEESKKLFEGLDVSAEQLSKMSADEQFFAIHEAISKLPDKSDQIEKLMLAFGDDGGKKFLGTLAKSTDQLREQAKGLQQSQADLDAATKAQEAMNVASAAWNKVWQSVATIVAPVIAQIATAFSDFVAKTPQLAKWILMGGAAFLALGAALTIIGPMIAGTVTVVGALVGAVGFLLSPVGLAVVAIGALAGGLGYALHQSGALATAFDWLMEKLAPFIETFKTAFASIKDSLAAGQFADAAKTLWAAIKVAFAEGMAWVKSKWIDLKTALAMVFVTLSGQIESIWARLTAFIVSSMLKAISGALKLASAAADMIPGMGDKAKTLGMMAIGADAAAGVAEAGGKAKVAGIARDTAATQSTLLEDAARQKAGLSQAPNAARAEFAAAVSTAATNAAKAAVETAAPAAAAGGGGPATPQARKADNAVNRGLDIRSAEGLESVMKAISGGDGTEAAVKQGNKISQGIAKDIAEMRKKGMTVVVGKTK